MKLLVIILTFTICSNCAISQNIEIQYLANEGIKISSAKGEILIDAFFDNEFEAFDFLPSDTLKSIMHEGRSLEHSITLATHLHGDHYSSTLTGEYLLTNSKNIFVAPQETIKHFEQQYAMFDEIHARVKSIDLTLYEHAALDLDWVKITIVRLAHMGDAPWKEAENLAYLIELDNRKVLHVGDALLDEINLQALKITDINIDAVVLPLGQMMSKEQLTLINKYINTTQILVAHIPISYYDKAHNLLSELGYQNILVQNQPMKKILLK